MQENAKHARQMAEANRGKSKGRGKSQDTSQEKGRPTFSSHTATGDTARAATPAGTIKGVGIHRASPTLA